MINTHTVRSNKVLQKVDEILVCLLVCECLQEK